MREHEMAEASARQAAGAEPAAAPSALYRALQVAAGFLTAISKAHNLSEDKTRAKLHLDGVLIGEFTLREALDMADAALDPANHKDCSVTAPKDNTNANPS